MAKMVLRINGAVQGEFPLDKERISIGRKPDNDVQIDYLAVSGKLVKTTPSQVKSSN